jgi:hypothetical protein
MEVKTLICTLQRSSNNEWIYYLREKEQLNGLRHKTTRLRLDRRLMLGQSR